MANGLETDRVPTEYTILPDDENILPDANETVLPLWKKTTRILFSAFFYTIIVSMVAGSTMFAFSNDESKAIFGHRFYTVLSDSMKPEFAKGDMIIVKLVDPSEIKIGDIVTFNPGGTKNAYLTHRIVGFADNRAGVAGNYVITRGDANNADDPPTPIERIIGKQILNVPYAGFVVNFAQENFVPIFIIIICSYFLILILKSYYGNGNRHSEQQHEKMPNGISPLNDISRPV